VSLLAIAAKYQSDEIYFEYSLHLYKHLGLYSDVLRTALSERSISIPVTK
jgi:hypothetical protein